mmetsp:Transcript_4782/g.15697  ORF Transcript_4782/g.15697 Transcript_4782/m.15697 type:complete len:293 (-) Transcript_4782:281-1159(-)
MTCLIRSSRCSKTATVPRSACLRKRLTATLILPTVLPHAHGASSKARGHSRSTSGRPYCGRSVRFFTRSPTDPPRFSISSNRARHPSTLSSSAVRRPTALSCSRRRSSNTKRSHSSGVLSRKKQHPEAHSVRTAAAASSAEVCVTSACVSRDAMHSSCDAPTSHPRARRAASAAATAIASAASAAETTTQPRSPSVSIASCHSSSLMGSLSSSATARTASRRGVASITVGALPCSLSSAAWMSWCSHARGGGRAGASAAAAGLSSPGVAVEATASAAAWFALKIFTCESHCV